MFYYLFYYIFFPGSNVVYLHWMREKSLEDNRCIRARCHGRYHTVVPFILYHCEYWLICMVHNITCCVVSSDRQDAMAGITQLFPFYCISVNIGSVWILAYLEAHNITCCVACSDKYISCLGRHLPFFPLYCIIGQSASTVHNQGSKYSRAWGRGRCHIIAIFVQQHNDLAYLQAYCITCWGGRILERNWDKSLKRFPPCYSQ